jgi:hypothetical protein
MSSKDTNYSKNQPLLNSFLFLTFAIPKAVLWGFPSPFRPSGRTKPPPRRGVRVVEGARLESVYTGNCIAGSNPALSAKTPENQRFALVFLCLFGTKLASVTGKGIKTPATEGGQVFRGFEAPPPARDLLSGAIKIPLSLPQNGSKPTMQSWVFYFLGNRKLAYRLLGFVADGSPDADCSTPTAPGPAGTSGLPLMACTKVAVAKRA